MASSHPRAARFVQKGLFDGVATFRELEARISALSEELDEGDAFEIFFEAFLATQPVMQAEAVHLVGQVPLDLRQTLNLPADAKGIDGVFRTKTGHVVPYQVKFRAGRPRLGFAEVAPFLGVTERAKDRLIVTNAEVLADDTVRRDGLRTLRGSDFDALSQDDLAAITDWLRARPVRRAVAVPRDDQREAVDALVAALRDHGRATVVMACGSGKTLVQLWAAEALAPERVLVLVPSLALIKQTLREWSSNTAWGDRFRYLCVCSDPTVTQGLDELDPLRIAPTDLDFRVDTDPEEVRRFLEGPHDGVRVVFSTYQSSPVVAAGMQDCPPFDFAVFDEAHKTTGPRDGVFAFALDDEKLAIRKRAFFTATPRHYLRQRDREGDFRVVSMDDEAVYGPTAYRLSFAEAVGRGIICDYRVILSVVDPEAVTEFALKHGITLVKGDLQQTRWVATQVAVARAVAETGARKVITFHTRVSHAKIFASDTARGIGQYLDGFGVSHVNGEQSAADREAILSGFADERPRLVTNARCLTEGVDLPAVDMVAFINPRKSKVDIVQATGRAMRKPRGRPKELGYIVVPVLLAKDEAESVEDACRKTDWEDVIDVLAALRDQDSRLVEVIAELRQARGRGEVFNPQPLRERIQVLGPIVGLDVLQRSVGSVVLDRLGVSWDVMLGRLEAFKAKLGHVAVPQDYPDDPALGAWCSNQRTLRKQGKLSVGRVRRLDGLGFVWDQFQDAWEEMFSRLEAFRTREGHANVPSGYGADPRLGTWCNKQRRLRKRGKLSAERVQRLDSVGFLWGIHDSAWEEMYGRLEEFSRREQSVDVPDSYPADPSLAVWVHTQRGLRKRGKLSAERVQRLEVLGFAWDKRAENWEEMLERLEKFTTSEGHANVPLDYSADPSLGVWVVNQRRLRKRGKLVADRVRRLEALGFVWERHASAWDEMFSRLEAYRTREGHATVPTSYSVDPKLARWCNTQRVLWRKGELPPDRVRRLDSLGFVWDQIGASWEEMIARLEAFKAREGHANVPVDYPADRSLGPWTAGQRQRRKTGKLSPDRIQRLDALGFEWEPKKREP